MSIAFMSNAFMSNAFMSNAFMTVKTIRRGLAAAAKFNSPYK